MITFEDDKYITDGQRDLLKRGMAQMSVHSLHFTYLASSIVTEMSEEEHKSFVRERDTALNHVRLTAAACFDIHQSSTDKSTMSHYKSDWDLFFWSDRIWNNTEFISHISLTFNSNRTAKQNMELLSCVLSKLKASIPDNIYCRVQYEVRLDDDAVNEAAQAFFDTIQRKVVYYKKMPGKVKPVINFDSSVRFGFFNKGAKKKYHPLTNVDLLTEITI